MFYDKIHVVPFDYFALMTQPTPESDHFRATLLTLQRDLLALSSTGQESAQPVELDQTTVGRVSRMDALQQQAMAQSAQQRRLIQLQRIESALQRLENGKFGWCVRCGEEISRKRLDVDPTAPLCIAWADGRSQYVSHALFTDPSPTGIYKLTWRPVMKKSHTKTVVQTWWTIFPHHTPYSS